MLKTIILLTFVILEFYEIKTLMLYPVLSLIGVDHSKSIKVSIIIVNKLRVHVQKLY